ncbi:hypothetical protein JOC58_003983 [Paenibacillus hunanensis]|uniref:Uncharacterized protein n=1 Tax=Paenibacillus hunanensis TaxID=539262 RepID=A0ABU1J3S8_9BACL|nr:hypothetical protein [Paenibacillus hunanensis]
MVVCSPDYVTVVIGTLVISMLVTDILAIGTLMIDAFMNATFLMTYLYNPDGAVITTYCDGAEKDERHEWIVI